MKRIIFTIAIFTFSMPVVHAQWTTSGSDIYYSAGKVGINDTSPAYHLDIAGSMQLQAGRYYIYRSNVKSQMFTATNGQGSGWMINANYSGTGNPQGNSTYNIDPGQHNTSAGYLDFDGNGRNWSFNISAPSPGVDSAVSWTQIALFDNAEVTLSPTGNDSDFNIQADGEIGIGIDSPSANLHVSSSTSGDAILKVESDTDNNDENDNARIAILQDGGAHGAYIGYNSDWSGIDSDNRFRIVTRRSGTNDEEAFVIKTTNSGSVTSSFVGIGTSNPDQALTVKGKIHSEEIIVDLNVPGPDYVFEEDYDLPTLSEIEAFIKANKHLPEVPSAKEMEANGISLGEMNMLLLKKIEELTLITIAQQKQINELIKRDEKK